MDVKVLHWAERNCRVIFYFYQHFHSSNIHLVILFSRQQRLEQTEGALAKDPNKKSAA